MLQGLLLSRRLRWSRVDLVREVIERQVDPSKDLTHRASMSGGQLCLRDLTSLCVGEERIEPAFMINNDAVPGCLDRRRHRQVSASYVGHDFMLAFDRTPIRPAVTTEHDLAICSRHHEGLVHGSVESAVDRFDRAQLPGPEHTAEGFVQDQLLGFKVHQTDPSGSWDLTGVPVPPGLVRPNNAVLAAESWADFDQQLARAVPYAADLPVDRELGRIAETFRLEFDHERGTHPLFSFLAVGEHAQLLIGERSLGDPLAPIEQLHRLDGDVLLLGVTHTSNTTIHLAEQQLGRSRFYRYAKAAEGVWMELPS